MAEPQPSTIRPGPTDIDEEGFETTTTTTVPTSAEDRKTAAALSSVSAHVDDDDEDRKVGKEVDREALGRAMKSLDLSVGHTSDGGAGAGAGACGGSSSSSKSKGGRMLEDDDEQSKKKSIKVDPVDVTIVVSPSTSTPFAS